MRQIPLELYELAGNSLDMTTKGTNSIDNVVHGTVRTSRGVIGKKGHQFRTQYSEGPYSENPQLDYLGDRVTDKGDICYSKAVLFSGKMHPDWIDSLQTGYATQEPEHGKQMPIEMFAKSSKDELNPWLSIGMLADGTSVDALTLMRGLNIYQKAKDIAKESYHSSMLAYGLASERLEQDLKIVQDTESRLDILHALSVCYRKLMIYKSMSSENILVNIPYSAESLAVKMEQVNRKLENA